MKDLPRKLEFYKQEYERLSHLAADLQQEMENRKAEAFRAGVTARLFYTIFSLTSHDLSGSIEQQRRQVLQILLDTMMVDCAAIFELKPDNTFVVIESLGLNLSHNRVEFNILPGKFHFCTSHTRLQAPLDKMQHFTGMSCFLWACSYQEKMALLVGCKTENHKWPSSFGAEDEEMITQALQIITHIITKQQKDMEIRRQHLELEKMLQERTSELVRVNEELKKEINRRKWGEKRIKRSLQELKFLSRTAMDFVESSSNEDIYRLIGKHLYSILNHAIIIINSYSVETMTYCIRAVFGLPAEAEKILGQSPLGFTSLMPEDIFERLKKKKVITYTGDLYTLWNGDISQAVCDRLIEYLNITGYYIAGFMRNGELYGSAVILARDGMKVRTSGVLSTFINQASIALQRKNAEDTILYHAYHDALCDLPNRKLFNEYFKKALATASSSNQMMALAFLDLDHFKEINDTLGHDVGDLLLKDVARRLKSCLRKDDFVARLGGDEFIILLPGITHEAEAEGVARKILNAIRRPFVFNNQEIYVTASIGIGIYPHDGQDTETLLKKTDAKMYQAKKRGRDNYQFYRLEQDEKVLSQSYWKKCLRQAIFKSEFEIYYQPLYDLNKGQVSATEALLRWHHPEHGLISPEKFMSLAEDSGLIVPIGKWVLKAACRQNQLWQEAGYSPVKMMVNISQRQVEESDFVSVVEQVLDETKMDNQYLVLEFAESFITQNRNLAIATMQALKDKGIYLSLDNYGRGLSALTYLKTLPVDSLKIDRQLISELNSDSGTAAIVTALINLAKELHLDVIAVGVGNARELAFLKERRCDMAQGYLFGKAIPAENMERILQIKP